MRVPPALPRWQHKFDVYRSNSFYLDQVVRVMSANECGRRFAASDIARLFRWLRVIRGVAFHRLRSAPFEGAAIGIPPALPEDCYFGIATHARCERPVLPGTRRSAAQCCHSVNDDLWPRPGRHATTPQRPVSLRSCRLNENMEFDLRTASSFFSVPAQ